MKTTAPLAVASGIGGKSHFFSYSPAVSAITQTWLYSWMDINNQLLPFSINSTGLFVFAVSKYRLNVVLYQVDTDTNKWYYPRRKQNCLQPSENEGNKAAGNIRRYKIQVSNLVFYIQSTSADISCRSEETNLSVSHKRLLMCYHIKQSEAPNWYHTWDCPHMK